MEPIGYHKRMFTVREFGDFYKDAVALLGEDGYEELVAYIALNPEAGDVIRGSGGFRKLRFKRPGTGKSGGVRTIYFFYTPKHPISLLAIYGKNERANVTQAEINELSRIARILKGENHG